MTAHALASPHQRVTPTAFDCDGVIVLFRPMTVEDYAEVRRILPGVSTCVLSHDKESFQSILSIPTYHPCCAYREDTGELVGYAELYRLPHIGRNYDGRIERVIVVENFRGLGLASAMCDYLITEAEDHLDCNRVELTVEKPNARHIYENKLNFSVVDTTVMRLKLPRDLHKNHFEEDVEENQM